MNRLSAHRDNRARGRVRHAAYSMVALGLVAGTLALLVPSAPTRQFISLTLAYTSLGALLVTLAIGPLNVMLGHRNPLSTDTRRDAGLAAAAAGISHTVISLTNHFGGDIATYFFTSGELAVRSVRRDAFGAGVWTGAFAVVLLVLLAAISSDAAMRGLGRRRWKRIQRWNYALAILTVAHTAAFWIALSRGAIVVAASAATVAVTVGLQVSGARRVRRASGRP